MRRHSIGAVGGVGFIAVLALMAMAAREAPTSGPTSRPTSRPTTRAASGAASGAEQRELLERFKAIEDRRAGAVKLARELTHETLDEARRNFAELAKETSRFNERLAPLAAKSPLKYPSKMPPDGTIGKAIWLYKAGKAVEAYNRSKQGEMSEDEYVVFWEVNRYRTALGLVPVEYDVRLRDAARGHSRWMSETQQFEHEEDRPGSKTFSQRIKNEGYDWMGAAENIAEGHPDAQAVFTGWFDSPGHHHNLVGDYTHMGVGKVDKYWTQEFGKGEPVKADSKMVGEERR